MFNALASRRLAETAPRPFTTIDPHEAVVPVPDDRLKKLIEAVRGQWSVNGEEKEPDVVPASVKFIDIAGLVKNAHKGEGLGNQFLAKIREVDVVVHTINAYQDQDIERIKSDYEIISTELILSDLQVLERVDEKELRGDVYLNEVVGKLKVHLNKGLKINEIKLSKDEEKLIDRFFFLTNKPEIIVINISEGKLSQDLKEELGSVFADYVALSARLAEELIELPEVDRVLYKNELKNDLEGLDEIIVSVYKLLNLITFYTIKGGVEITAWSLKRGSSALGAAGVVHSDFADKFIKAEVLSVEELVKEGSWKEAKEKGKIRLEGKDYVIRDGDVVEFKVGA